MILITIGRGQDNKYVVNDPKKNISRYHAEIKVHDDNSMTIMDISTNGTYINGKRIESNTEIQVSRSDEVYLAKEVKLNWTKIPSLPPIEPGTKIYSIGKHFNNRIVVNDPSGSISRYHATLKISPKGKMTLTDHSANGTYVNGMRIPSNQDVPVRRKDKVMLANTQAFDWTKVKEKSSILSDFNPLYAIVPAAAVIIIAIVVFIYPDNHTISPTNKPGNKKLSPEQIYDSYSDAVVWVMHIFKIVGETAAGERYVVNFDKEGKLQHTPENSPQASSLYSSASATAFFVDENGTLMTNRHVTIPWEYTETLEGAKRVNFKAEAFYKVTGETVFIGYVLDGTHVNQIGDFTECAVVSKETKEMKVDVGILIPKSGKLPYETLRYIDIKNAMTDREALERGQDIHVMGYPFGDKVFSWLVSGTTNTIQVTITTQDGIINTEPNKVQFGVNAQMDHGASGSPVLNDKGQLIGVFNSGMPGTQGLNYAILVKHAVELYNKAIL